MSVSQWDKFLESYNRKKEIEGYQEKRILVRPKTTKLSVVVHVFLFFGVITGVAVLLFVVSQLVLWIKITAFILCLIGLSESYCRIIAVKVVECYQHYAKEETRRRCKCIPSCSEYAILCLRKYELIYALIRIRKRLFITCKGFDYIVDNP